MVDTPSSNPGCRTSLSGATYEGWPPTRVRVRTGLRRTELPHLSWLAAGTRSMRMLSRTAAKLGGQLRSGFCDPVALKARRARFASGQSHGGGLLTVI